MGKFIININGELYNEDNAKISVFDRGFLYGDSVYEATRTFNRKPFRIERHLDRLFKSAAQISLIPTLTIEEILYEIERTINAAFSDDLSLRIVLTRGDNEDLGLNPTLAHRNNLIIFCKAIDPNPESWLTEGVKMVFFQKITSANKALPKTGNYQENMLAYKKAQEAGAFDALMINPEGFVTEGTTSNAWLLKDGTLFTSPLSDGVLEGLTRQTLFEMAQKEILCCPLKEKSLTPEDFLSADECFITSTSRNLVPVTFLEGKPIGTGKPGTFTLKLLEDYKNFVELD
jgi:branched-chain amino acid aminotransferase